MHLLDAWTSLDPLRFARLLAIPAAVLLATLLPGRAIARGAALLIAVLVAASPEISVPGSVRAGWVLAWLLVAALAGARGHHRGRVGGARRGAIEAGVLAVPLGLALVALLLAAVSRQAFHDEDARRATLGVLVLGTGVLHLMTRRHVRRALVAFAALGLGLELLAASARAADVTHAGAPAGLALVATLLVTAIGARIAGARERHAGSPLVSDAHELHD